jgi:hypothetical protein
MRNRIMVLRLHGGRSDGYEPSALLALDDEVIK